MARRKTVKPDVEPKETKENIDAVETAENKDIAEGLDAMMTSVFGANEQSKKLFDDLLAEQARDKPSQMLDICGHEVEVKQMIGAFNLHGAIKLMVSMMKEQKDSMGFPEFQQFIPEFEFMFWVSFYTNIGFHQRIDQYIRLRNLFTSYGQAEFYYYIDPTEYEIARSAFDRMYATWRDEYLAMMSFIPHAISPSNGLANKLLKTLGDDDEYANMMNDPEAQMLFSELALMARKHQEAPNSAPELPVAGIGHSFQKRDIDAEHLGNIIDFDVPRQE